MPHRHEISNPMEARHYGLIENPALQAHLRRIPIQTIPSVSKNHWRRKLPDEASA
jgi:hypothetical protein